MLQSPPNIAYLKAAWAAFAGISGANAQQSYEAAGLSFSRINHSTLVRKNDIQVSTMPLHYTRHDLRVGFLGRIENEVRKVVAQMEPILLRELNVPEGHELVVDLEDCLRQLRRKGNRSLSIMVRPERSAELDATVSVDMRVFLDSPRACLFICLADAASQRQFDLLAAAPKRVRVPRADSYADLAQQLAASVNAALTLDYANQLAA
ncbi:hypothetical protein DVT68_03445 [Dyella solisilvae]|uniref:Uncharacterized protein n=1 Tax=Dyella solisilvae TaxID=1920168 RepID=A0A370KB67_9GAMM|nr:hypothetical protein [Dyella solisilvae]RDI99895.1 hypothetical protein DVT68_03445 [Dyella solisilvae]